MQVPSKRMLTPLRAITIRIRCTQEQYQLVMRLSFFANKFLNMKELKSKIVPIRFTKSEYDKLVEVSKQDRRTLSDYIRNVLFSRNWYTKIFKP